MARNNQGASIDAGILSRVVNGVRGFVAGISGDTWFSPGQPVPAQEPDAQRTFEYPAGVNVAIQPRANEPLQYRDLRAFSSSYDILRLAIETRKDQLGALAFNIQSRDNKKSNKTRTKRIYDYLAYPDQEHPWSTWLRLLIEDLLVIDAPTIYPRMARGGQLYSLEVLDGATIKRILDEQGRTPLPPSPAYQQVLYGIPAVNFNRDELVYMPRNPRTHKIYGFSPVEQIINTINTALRRQISQLNYFTDGNMPEAFMGVPETWSVEQIKKFQEYFDALLSGDLAARRKLKFIPGGLNYQPVKEPDLKTEFDEWLARIVCFAFSLPPTPFIKQINRSMAEAAQETALEEGLAPLKQWVKEVMDYIIAKYFKSPDLEFSWQPGEIEQDPLTKAQIHHIYVTDGTMTKDEVREELGLPQLTAEQLTQQQQAANPQQDSDQKNKVQSLKEDERATEDE